MPGMGDGDEGGKVVAGSLAVGHAVSRLSPMARVRA